MKRQLDQLRKYHKFSLPFQSETDILEESPVDVSSQETYLVELNSFDLRPDPDILVYF